MRRVCNGTAASPLVNTSSYRSISKLRNSEDTPSVSRTRSELESCLGKRSYESKQILIKKFSIITQINVIDIINLNFMEYV